jgi:hypothetical protein
VNNGKTRAKGASRWKVRIWVAGWLGMAAVLHEVMRIYELKLKAEDSHQLRET